MGYVYGFDGVPPPPFPMNNVPYLFARKSPQLGGFCLRLRVNVTQGELPKKLYASSSSKRSSYFVGLVCVLTYAFYSSD